MPGDGEKRGNQPDSSDPAGAGDSQPANFGPCSSDSGDNRKNENTGEICGLTSVQQISRLQDIRDYSFGCYLAVSRLEFICFIASSSNFFFLILALSQLYADSSFGVEIA